MRNLRIIAMIMLCMLPVLFIGGAVALCYTFNYCDPHQETITVTEKTIGINNQEESYLIYTDGEVYKIQDLLFVGFFTSSDVFGYMQVGKTYNVQVRGRRFPFLSFYKNITYAKELE